MASSRCGFLSLLGVASGLPTSISQPLDEWQHKILFPFVAKRILWARFHVLRRGLPTPTLKPRVLKKTIPIIIYRFALPICSAVLHRWSSNLFLRKNRTNFVTLLLLVSGWWCLCGTHGLGGRDATEKQPTVLRNQPVTGLGVRCGKTFHIRDRHHPEGAPQTLLQASSRNGCRMKASTRSDVAREEKCRGRSRL